MTVIRGATTITADEPEEIRKAVKELLDQTVSRNGLHRDEILSIVFSSTSDIHSYYPAKAAREAGYSSSPLFSSQEPDIEGGLPLCIRVMLFVEKNIEPHHVYLRGARVLRKDIATKINIAIDGPAGSGKSTMAKALAKSMNILYLDTGAMYRACALKALKEKRDLSDETDVIDCMRGLSLEIEYEDGAQKTILDGEDVSELIRKPEVYPAVRLKMVEKQREIADKMSCVLDGRDIGTYVLPEADFKFFLTADPKVRAQRRFDELTAKGYPVDKRALEEEIVKRDEQDSSRAFAPLKQAEDAVLIDTSNLTPDEVLGEMKRTIQEKI